MPPDGNGMYPDQGSGWNTGDYRTFTNSVIINKTVLVPTYDEQYDTTALRIYRENMPGYRVVGIDCNNIIQASGAIHCITKAVGVEDPLLISHQELDDISVASSSYEVNALIKHRSGIANAVLYYTTDTAAGYQSVPMSLTNASNATWTGNIPEQPVGSTIYYYVGAAANSGKTQVRPLPAPAGCWKFKVLVNTVSVPLYNAPEIVMEMAYPNPAGAITCIPVYANIHQDARIRLLDVLGREVKVLFQGELPIGKSHYFFNAESLPPGPYHIEMTTVHGMHSQKIMVK